VVRFAYGSIGRAFRVRQDGWCVSRTAGWVVRFACGRTGQTKFRGGIRAFTPAQNLNAPATGRKQCRHLQMKMTSVQLLILKTEQTFFQELCLFTRHLPDEGSAVKRV